MDRKLICPFFCKDMRPLKIIAFLLCLSAVAHANDLLDAYVKAQDGVSGASFKVSKVEQVSGDSWLVIVSPAAKDGLMEFRERDPEAEYDLVRELFGKLVLLGKCRFDGVSGSYVKFRYERATKYEGTVDADTVRLVGISRNAEVAQSNKRLRVIDEMGIAPGIRLADEADRSTWAESKAKPTQKVVEKPEPEADSPNERSGKAGELAVVTAELRKLESALVEVERFLRSPPEGAQLADLARQLELKEGLQKRIEAARETRSRVEVELGSERKQAFLADYAAYAKIPDGSEYAAAKQLGWRQITAKWQVDGGREPGRLVWDDAKGVALLDQLEFQASYKLFKKASYELPSEGTNWDSDTMGWFTDQKAFIFKADYKKFKIFNINEPSKSASVNAGSHIGCLDIGKDSAKILAGTWSLEQGIFGRDKWSSKIAIWEYIGKDRVKKVLDFDAFPSASISRVAFSHDERFILAQSRKSIRIWNAFDASLLRGIDGSGPFAVSPTEPVVATPLANNKIQLLRLDSLDAVNEFEGTDPSWSPSGEFLTVVRGDKTYIIESLTSKVVGHVLGTNLEWSRDESMLATVIFERVGHFSHRRKGKVAVWNKNELSRVNSIEIGKVRGAIKTKWLGNSRSLLVGFEYENPVNGDAYDRIRIYDAMSGSITSKIPLPKPKGRNTSMEINFSVSPRYEILVVNYRGNSALHWLPFYFEQIR